MRLITRSDFDGLVCAVLLKELNKIDAIEFVHPKDVQDGKVKAGPNDILTNLPYQQGVGLWFDHHASETVRNDMKGIRFEGRFDVAPSAARVIYDYYKKSPEGKKLKKYAKLLEAVDKSDAADLTKKDVTKPSGWILLSYVMDPRTGLAYSKDYAISNRDLMMKMVDWIAQYKPDDLLKLPDVKERVDRYLADVEKFKKITLEHSRQEKNVIITDIRGKKDLPAGNRFLVYTLFPKANVQVRIFDGKAGEFTVCAVGHSIFNRTCRTDVGKLMGKYGGGGHRGAGTCQLPLATADETIKKIVATLKRNG